MMDDFTQAYFEAALWSTNDESDESGGVPLDENYTIEDFAPETRSQMINDARSFQQMNSMAIEADNSPEIREHGRWELAGHDFWLDRNGHGAGFEDGQWPKFGEVLAKSARSFGQYDLYVGDDGLIHGSGGHAGLRESRRSAHHHPREEAARWTYEGYWNTVLGANRSAVDVIDEFDLRPTDRRGIEKWLEQAEAEAWSAGGHEEPLPAEWRDFHERAVRELTWVTPHRQRSDAHHHPREEAAKNDYRVVVNGHVVYHGHNNRDALLIYHEHMRKIKAGHERGKAEVFKNGEMEREFVWGREHSRRTHEARKRRGLQNQEIDVWNPRQSEALPDREDAVDVDVSVGSIDGEATVVRGHQGFETYGNAPDYWLSGNLLRTLQEELTDEQFTRVLREIASQAEEVAERWSRGQLRETPRHRPDKSFHFLVGRYYLIDKKTGAVLAGPFDSTEDAEKHQRRSRFDTYIWQNQHSGGRPPSSSLSESSPKPFHVYAEDGFESAHSSLEAAKRAAARGARRRHMRYEVVRTSPHGFTGGGHGHVVATFGSDGREIK